MAFGTEDFGVGTVEVRYNGTPVLNIHSTRIQIQNDSNRDLTDLEVNVRFSEGTWVLRSFGSVTQSVQQIPPTDATQFATSAPIPLAGLSLPAGKYTLWTVPHVQPESV
jgi:hypothetical protein